MSSRRKFNAFKQPRKRYLAAFPTYTAIANNITAKIFEIETDVKEFSKYGRCQMALEMFFHTQTRHLARLATSNPVADLLKFSNPSTNETFVVLCTALRTTQCH